MLFAFDSSEIGKHYIVYTDNTQDEAGNVKVFASIYNLGIGKGTLTPIETDEEWGIIEAIIEELQCSND